MRAISLQSGSNGNCIYVEAGGLRLLFDAGISASLAIERAAARGIDLEGIDALLISHDHSDHCRSLGIFQRRFAVPAYITQPTLEAAACRCKLGKLGEVRHFSSGETLRIGSVRIETVPTPHDGADGVGFVIDDGHRRLGILTDLGHVFDPLPAVLASLDGVLLESNYDPEMLADGGYPEFLKRRITGPGGHLSNAESAGLLAAARRLCWACLAHLSADNNSPEIALATHDEVLQGRLPLHIAGRYAVGEALTL